MPRGRILDKEAISRSQKMSLLSSDTTRLIYTWLIAHLDREGRFSADPTVIKGNIFPRINNMTLRKIENSLLEMAHVNLIVLYQEDGDRYLQFTKFKEYQTHLDREALSKIPAPNNENIINSGLNPIKSAEVPLIQFNSIKDNSIKANKNIYAEFVLMTTEEHQKLVDKYGEKNTQKFIEKLNNTKGANKKLKYDSDYFAILKWVVEAVIGDEKKKELEKAYQLAIKKEKEWDKNKVKREKKTVELEKGKPEVGKIAFYKTMIKLGSPKSEEYRKKLKELEGEKA